MKTLEEIRARLSEINDRLVAIKSMENPADCAEEIQKLAEERAELSKKESALATLNAVTEQTSAGRKTAPTSPKIEVVDRHAKTGGFANLGDFAMAIKNHASGKIDNRFMNSTHFEFVGEDGGFLIPEDFMATIEKKMGGDDSLLSRTKQLQSSSNHAGFPIDEKQPWNGGVQAYWMEEGGDHTPSKVSLGKAKFELHKLGVFVKATDELLEDAAALNAYIAQSAPEAINYKINNAILTGDGVGKPVGILNSGFKVKVSKEVGQTADTIVYKNILKMKSRFLSKSGGIWIAHPQCREQLMQLKDDNGNFIYLNGQSFANASVAPFETLAGLPIVYMMGSIPALGDEGDLILADLSYYYSVLKRGGIKSGVSTHLYFDKDITAYKFTLRLDGKCPFKAPVTTEKGNYEMSGFVTLEDRT